MKKILLLNCVILFTISCSDIKTTHTAQQIAEENIKQYLLVKLNDPKSYESVSFGKLDTINAEQEYLVNIDKLKNDTLLYDNYLDMQKIYLDVRDELKNCYRITHKYRAKNSYGALILSGDDVFILDSTLKVKSIH